MGKSFQDQLLALGLVDKKKLKQTKKDKHQQRKQQAKTRKGQAAVDENARLAREAEARKKARVQELNRQREEKLKKRADAARIRQFVEQNRVEQNDRGQAYRFNHQGKIRRIFVHKDTATQLSRGSLGILHHGGSFEVLPRDILERIRTIDSALFIHLVENTGKQEPDPDDPYVGYEVPDDLMW